MNRLGIYAALPDELDTAPIQALARARGLPLLWPRVAGAALEFVESEPAQLVAGAFGIPAPPPDGEVATLGSGDLLLIPGRGFDRRGVRLGRGRGFYDRSGLRVPGLACVGLGYSFQLVERLPAEAHDLRVEAVLTDTGLHPTRTA